MPNNSGLIGVRTHCDYLQRTGGRFIDPGRAHQAKVFNGTNKPMPGDRRPNPGKPRRPSPSSIFRSDESGTTDNFQRYLTQPSDGA